MDSTSLKTALAQLEDALKNANLWDSVEPKQALLTSTAPFMVDTLDFNQWLQWILIPKLTYMIEHNIPMPEVSNITSMAEVWLQQKKLNQPNLLIAIKAVDSAFLKN